MKHIIIVLMILISWDCFAQSIPTTKPTITFVSRLPSVKDKSGAGHIYVIVSGEAERYGIGMTHYQAFGFYAKTGIGFWGNVPGKIIQESTNNKIYKKMSVRVSQAQLFKALDVKEKWKNSRYRLNGKNCISFVIEIAKIANLRIPRRPIIAFPTIYLNKLIFENRNRIKRPVIRLK